MDIPRLRRSHSNESFLNFSSHKLERNLLVMECKRYADSIENFEELDFAQNRSIQTHQQEKLRGRTEKSGTFGRLRGTIRSRADLVHFANSKSTEANVKRAKKALLHFSQLQNAPDPEKDT